MNELRRRIVGKLRARICQEAGAATVRDALNAEGRLTGLLKFGTYLSNFRSMQNLML